MANDTMHKDSAALEREVEAQRHRVESTIGALRDRLSPGQLLDEALSYTKHGGAHFASNLGHQLTANPVPTALLGISLAWLMMGSGRQHAHDGRAWNGHSTYRPDYARATGGGLQRISHARDDAGEWYAEFSDDLGKKYRAKSNELGHRAGHFMDETGKQFAGFVDDAGRRVEQFRDEAGNLLEEATGWASHTWHDATQGLAHAGEAIAGQAGHLADQAGHFAHDAQEQAARMTRTALRTLEQQPLVAAALAFAAGAAIGAVLPSTKEEDELLGKTSDEVKREAGHMASEAYEKGKKKAAELYEDATHTAEEVYSDAKRKVAGQPGTENSNVSRH